MTPRRVKFTVKATAEIWPNGFGLFIAQKNRNFLLFIVVIRHKDFFLNFQRYEGKTVSRPSLDDIIVVNIKFEANGESPRSRRDQNEQFGLFTFYQIIAKFLQNGKQFLTFLVFWNSVLVKNHQKYHRNRNLTKKIIEYGDRSWFAKTREFWCLGFWGF